MRAVLNTLIDELSRLKASGVKTVNVSPDSLALLGKLVGEARAQEPAVTLSLPDEVAPARAPETKATPAAPAAQGAKIDKPLLAAFDEVKDTPAPAKTQTPKRLPPPTPFELPAGDKNAKLDWLRARVENDSVCKAQLREGKKLVLGVGSLDAKIMFVGEAPGAEEENQGEPFVGPAGQLLTKMIQAMGLKREEVYIGNIMNWRPQLPLGNGGVQYGNREPNEEEMAYCLPHLRAQIEIVQPTIIVGLGATAAKGLLGHNAFRTLGEIRGRWQDYLGRPLLITYHPSYLLRKGAESKESERKAKRAAWEDFLKVMEKAGLPISEKQRGYFL